MLSVYRYDPLPTARAIHADEREVLAVVGPWGSGKSTIGAIDLYLHCLKYKCDALVIRDTYPALRDSCLKKWMEIFGEAGHLNMGPPPTFKWKGPLAGREVMFRSAESPEDIQKFGSVEAGYAWLEEVCPGLLPGGVLNAGLSAEVFSGVIGRIRKWFVPNGKRRILATSLPPPTTRHWFHSLFYDRKPLLRSLRQDAMDTLLQQLALYRIAPDENKANLPENYYELQTAFLTSEDQVQRFIRGEVGSGYGVAGVYAEQWSDAFHIGEPSMAPRPGPLIVGVDGGLDASAIIMQLQPDDRMEVYGELVTNGLGLEDFAMATIQYVNRLFGPHALDCYADPSVFAREPGSGQTGAFYLAKGGLHVKPAPQDPTVRISAVRQWLTRMTKDGPRLKIHPRCDMLIEGFRGAYLFKMAGGEVLQKVQKNEFSHPHDALQYPLAALQYRSQRPNALPPIAASQIDSLGRRFQPRSNAPLRPRLAPNTRFGGNRRGAS